MSDSATFRLVLDEVLSDRAVTTLANVLKNKYPNAAIGITAGDSLFYVPFRKNEMPPTDNCISKEKSDAVKIPVRKSPPDFEPSKTENNNDDQVVPSLLPPPPPPPPFGKGPPPPPPPGGKKNSGGSLVTLKCGEPIAKYAQFKLKEPPNEKPNGTLGLLSSANLSTKDDMEGKLRNLSSVCLESDTVTKSGRERCDVLKRDFVSYFVRKYDEGASRVLTYKDVCVAMSTPGHRIGADVHSAMLEKMHTVPQIYSHVICQGLDKLEFLVELLPDPVLFEKTCQMVVGNCERFANKVASTYYYEELRIPSLADVHVMIYSALCFDKILPALPGFTTAPASGSPPFAVDTMAHAFAMEFPEIKEVYAKPLVEFYKYASEPISAIAGAALNTVMATDAVRQIYNECAHKIRTINPFETAEYRKLQREDVVATLVSRLKQVLTWDMAEFLKSNASAFKLLGVAQKFDAAANAYLEKAGVLPFDYKGLTEAIATIASNPSSLTTDLYMKLLKTVVQPISKWENKALQRVKTFATMLSYLKKNIGSLRGYSGDKSRAIVNELTRMFSDISNDIGEASDDPTASMPPSNRKRLAAALHLYALDIPMVGTAAVSTKQNEYDALARTRVAEDDLAMLVNLTKLKLELDRPIPLEPERLHALLTAQKAVLDKPSFIQIGPGGKPWAVTSKLSIACLWPDLSNGEEFKLQAKSKGDVDPFSLTSKIVADNQLKSNPLEEFKKSVTKLYERCSAVSKFYDENDSNRQMYINYINNAIKFNNDMLANITDNTKSVILSWSKLFSKSSEDDGAVVNAIAEVWNYAVTNPQAVSSDISSKLVEEFKSIKVSITDRASDIKDVAYDMMNLKQTRLKAISGTYELYITHLRDKTLSEDQNFEFNVEMYATALYMLFVWSDVVTNITKEVQSVQDVMSKQWTVLDALDSAK